MPLARLSARARAQAPTTVDLFGLLRPRRNNLKARWIDRDAALLLYALREAGPLPGEIRFSDLRQLVHDGVLQYERAGSFSSGPRAARAFIEPICPATAGRSAKLSSDALHYAAWLQPLDVASTAFRLYAFNREPMALATRASLPDHNACLRVWGVAPGQPGRALLEASWICERALQTRPWSFWLPRALSEGDRKDLGYKLYISAPRSAAAEALQLVAERGRQFGLCAFKIAADANGLHRSDKFVMYFVDRDALRRAAAILQPALAHIPGMGVPFTAGIAGTDILSWAMDPRGVAGAHQSWRGWITRRLASALAAGRARSARERVARALAAARAAGVDTETWAMPSQIWD